MCCTPTLHRCDGSTQIAVRIKVEFEGQGVRGSQCYILLDFTWN